MIRHQTCAAVIGCMTAFNTKVDVQNYGLDILSKIALYAPKLGEKVSENIAFFFLYLTHYQTTNSRLFQTERVCRRQFQISRKWQKVI